MPFGYRCQHIPSLDMGEAALHETKKVIWFIAYKKEGMKEGKQVNAFAIVMTEI